MSIILSGLSCVLFRCQFCMSCYMLYHHVLLFSFTHCRRHSVARVIDCEQSLRMVTRARKARARKSSEASESRGEADSLSPVLPSLDLTD